MFRENSIGNFYAAFLGMALASVPEPDRNDLGEGFRLVPIEDQTEDKDFSHLYKDGVKVSDIIYRRGGLGGSFKNGYNTLISYPDYPKETFSGVWVIIDTEGKEVLRNTEKYSSDVSHVGGIVGRMKNTYYNLKTGETIGYGDKEMKTDEFIFIEHRYDWDSKQFATGVTKINMNTAEVELYPISKRR